MTANRTQLWLLCAVFMVFLYGCRREAFEPDGDGHPVSFTAGRSAVDAKTTFSGNQGSPGIESLTWDEGDRIRIYCEQSSSPARKYDDYILIPNTDKTTASVETAYPGSRGLVWGSGSHTFYSLYPSPTSEGAPRGINLGVEDGRGIATAVIPSNQDISQVSVSPSNAYYADMNLAYMTARASATEGGQVSLSFSPIVTTFYATVRNVTPSELHVESIRLSSATTPLCGTYKASINADGTHGFSYESGSETYVAIGDYARTDDNSVISASFGPDGLAIPVGESMTVALFAIPEDISGLTLTVSSVENGDVSLKIKDNQDQWLTFSGGYKHNLDNIGLPTVSHTVSVSPTVISYNYLGSYSDQEFTVESSRTVGATVYDMPWKTQILASGQWVDLEDVISEGEYQWLSELPLSSQDPADVAAATTRTYRRSVPARAVTSHEERLRSGVIYASDGVTEVTHNTPETAVDLSCYNFVTKTMESSSSTANTYVISSPGYYKIPLVFGNAVENGSHNADTYTGKAGLGHINDFICPFPNSSGTESSIHLVATRPWLNAARSQSARIDWEKYSHWDETLGEMVTSYRKNGDPTAVSVVDNISVVSGSGNERYMIFHVDETNIRPGNVIIASLDSYGNIQWSWQLWITDQTMTPLSVNNGSTDYMVLPVNLGWTDLGKGQYYAPREAVLRFASTIKEGVYSQQFTVRQREEETVSTSGWSTFYQWGRKDPMTEGPTVVYTNDGYLHESIKMPSYIMYDASSYWTDRYYDWTIHNYNNLWDSKNTSWATPSSVMPNQKTVYDPSPRGFCVAPDTAWDGFETYGYSRAGSEGVWFYTDPGRESSAFFPAAGYMDYLTAQVVRTGPTGYWTYHPGQNVQRRASYNLKFQYDAVGESLTLSTRTLEGADRSYGLCVRPVVYGN